ncbi:Serine/threonine phosphatase stp [Sinobacterium norvegicum]|uniref:Serine/threonine phosphatase stp n=1 Tax=Sinobacterium norvegicum TaxID=1641715 RepID=A0ABM9ADZ7_9GAMM|nr:protein phosphatase 2C domain-containing protein [Sinobacterium norvegicum]CAH0991154.1 Serine/threonine phosphatase stp [Sinobacterium norvegicum]
MVLHAITGLTHRGCKRSNNQDSIYYHSLGKRVSLLVVADGMGGYKGGEVASQVCVDSFQQPFERLIEQQQNWHAEQCHQFLAAALAAANASILTMRSLDANLAKMGTTCVAALVVGEKAYIVSVGDSRAYIMRDDKLQQLTTDDTLYSQLDMAQQEKLSDSPLNNILTNAIGVKAKVELQSYELDVAPGQVLLLASDGLTGELADDEILEIMKKSSRFDHICDELLESCLSAIAKDNVSIITFKVDK